MDLAVANFKVKVVNAISSNQPINFSGLIRVLRTRDEKRLDNVLQDLRRTGQIHFEGPLVGWKVGRGRAYLPMQRNRR